MNIKFKLQIIPLIAGLVISILTLWFWRIDGKAAEDFALDQNTTSKFLKLNGLNIHCSTNLMNDQCFQDYISNNSGQQVVLNFGNSQQHAINQLKSGDETVAVILHRNNLAKGNWVVTYSQPNANLQEHFLMYKFLLPRYKPVAIILPVFYDDMRETGIRSELLDVLKDKKTTQLFANSEYGNKLSEKFSSNALKDEADALSGTLQKYVESRINYFLERNFPVWSNRPAIRADLLSLLYKIRNFYTFL